MRDPYFYDDCDIIRNKLGIKEEKILEKAEVDISCNTIHEISVSPINGDYDFKHLCDFHTYIFNDIYDWAGQPRTVAIEKAEAVLGYVN
jgi:cell filamentation protein